MLEADELHSLYESLGKNKSAMIRVLHSKEFSIGDIARMMTVVSLANGGKPITYQRVYNTLNNKSTNKTPAAGGGADRRAMQETVIREIESIDLRDLDEALGIPDTAEISEEDLFEHRAE